MKSIEIVPINNFPIINKGDSISESIINVIKRNKLSLKKNDILVIAHKIISISEGRIIKLSDVKISNKIKKISKKIKKSPEITQLIFNESEKIIKISKNFIITKDKNGIIAANAGVDQSNLKNSDHALLLPKNPNKSAKRISLEIEKNFKKSIPVIISDSVGRPWRNGLTQIAIGSYGIKSIIKYDKDLYNNRLYDTDIPLVDEISSAAGLLMIKNAGIPVVIIRGYNYIPIKQGLKNIVRSEKNDVFI